MFILKLHNLVKEFDGIKAVDNLSFQIEEKSITALIGPNGSGKTTVFNLITGNFPQNKGKILFEGKEITSLSPYKIAGLSIGRTFQNIRLFQQISVLDNVILGYKHEKGSSFLDALFQTRRMKVVENTNRKKAQDILKLVGLTEKEDALAENLSHGQRKLLELARILAFDPKLLLLDEPTAGLFPKTKKLMLDLIRELKEKGKTVLLIEHDIDSVMDIANKVIVLNYGKKIAEGKAEEIMKNEEVLKAYLGESRV